MSLSVYATTGEFSAENEILDVPGMPRDAGVTSSTAEIIHRESGISVYGVVTPDDCLSIAHALRALIIRASTPHECGCEFCEYEPPSLDAFDSAEKLERVAAWFEAVAAQGWGARGSY